MRIFILLFVLAQAATPPAASPQQPTFAQAQARLAANDLDGAAKILETIISSTPTAWRSMNLLGTVRLRQKQYDAAIELFTKSYSLDQGALNTAPIYNIA